MNEPLAQRLRRIRSITKLRQKEIAAQLETSLATYRSWESGKRTPPKMAMAELERRLQVFPIQ